MVRKCLCAKCDFAVRHKEFCQRHKKEEHEELASKQHVGWSTLWKIVYKCPCAKCDFSVRQKEYCRQHVKDVHEVLASGMWHVGQRILWKKHEISVWYMHF